MIEQNQHIVHLYFNALAHVNLFRLDHDKAHLQTAFPILLECLSLVQNGRLYSLRAKIHYCLAKIYSNGVGHCDSEDDNIAYSFTLLSSIVSENPIGFYRLHTRLQESIIQQINRLH